MSPSEHHKNTGKNTTKSTDKITEKSTTEDDSATEEQWDTGLPSLDELQIRAAVMGGEHDGEIAVRWERGEHGEREQLYSYGEYTDLRYEDFVQVLKGDAPALRSLVEKYLPSGLS